MEAAGKRSSSGSWWLTAKPQAASSPLMAGAMQHTIASLPCTSSSPRGPRPKRLVCKNRALSSICRIRTPGSASGCPLNFYPARLRSQVTTIGLYCASEGSVYNPTEHKWPSSFPLRVLCLPSASFHRQTSHRQIYRTLSLFPPSDLYALQTSQTNSNATRRLSLALALATLPLKS